MLSSLVGEQRGGFTQQTTTEQTTQQTDDLPGSGLVGGNTGSPDDVNMGGGRKRRKSHKKTRTHRKKTRTHRKKTRRHRKKTRSHRKRR
jgi:hypothetical protein